MTQIKNVALLGADGKLGPTVLSALIAHNFHVTVLKRASSKSPTTHNPEIRIPDSFAVDEIVPALTNIHAVIVTVPGTQTDLQTRLADACVQAGVSRFIPADFGSCDSSSPLTQELVPLYKAKNAMREYLQGLAEKNPKFTWTSLVPGHFFDWSPEFLHIYPRERRVETLNGGGQKFSISTLARIAEATVRVLERPEVTANRMLFVQSFCVTQKEVIAALEKATGSQWAVKDYGAEEFKDEMRAKADEGDKEAVEDLVWYLGTVDANWETRKDFAMQELGLENEDLDSTVKRLIDDVWK